MSWIDRLLRRRYRKLSMEDSWEGYTASYNGTNFPSLVSHGWRKNELIFACISKKAHTAAQVGLKFFSGKTEIETSPVKKLIQRPNPYMSEYDFWSAIVIYQNLAGVAYWEKERSRAGQVVALWPLRPDWMAPLQLKDRVGLSGYEYRPDGGYEKTFLPADDVVAFRLWDPLGMFEAWPPVAVAARVGDVDNSATDYIKIFFQKGGTPPGLLTTEQVLTDSEVERIRANWRKRYGGYENWLDPAVLDRAAKYQQTGSTFKDMGFDSLDARDEARICMVLDVPPIIVNAKIGMDRSTYSNYAEARKAWWEDSLVPMYANLEDVIINQVLPEFDERVTCEWDFSRVSALQEDQNSRWERATNAWNAGGITLNEYREQMGFPALPNGNMLRQEPATIENFDEPEEPEEEEIGQEEEGKLLKAKSPPDDDIRRKHERAIQRGMEKFFSEQLSRIEKTLRQKALADVDNEFWEDEDDELRKILLPLILSGVIAAAELASKELLKLAGVGVDWALVNQAALVWSRSYTYDLVSNLNQTTRKVIQQEIGNWIEGGLPLDDLINALLPTFGPVRAEMIGVTEVTRAFSSGNIITWKESGVVEGKRWYTAEDELVCPICGPLADLDAIGLGDAWQTENGPVNEPPAHVNCRCWVQPFIEVPSD